MIDLKKVDKTQNEDKMRRPDWTEYFMEVTKVVAKRSTCLRRSVGAILVKKYQILATGYNGSPKEMKHCQDLGGCLREKLKIPSGERHEICRAVHAEQNAIIQAAVNGVNISGSTLYCTNHPCSICAKIIINAEIKEIYIENDYQDKLAKKLLKEAKIKVNILDK